jgi:hypothetical protein
MNMSSFALRREMLVTIHLHDGPGRGAWIEVPSDTGNLFLYSYPDPESGKELIAEYECDEFSAGGRCYDFNRMV